MQAPNWEESNTGQACLNLNLPCSQGNVPRYAVAVQKTVHVAQALAFATQFNIQVVVKSSGHDFQGRSTAANALLIWWGSRLLRCMFDCRAGCTSLLGWR